MNKRNIEIIKGREVLRSKSLSGEFELISGCMYAAKTGTLINKIDREVRSGETAIIFKPSLDNRWGLQEKIGSHDGRVLVANMVPHDNAFLMIEAIKSSSDKISVVGIDEIQFFSGGDKGIRNTIAYMVDKMGLRVYGAGLFTDFRGEAFGQMAELSVEADSHVNVRAICVRCGKEASRTQRIINGQPAKYTDPVVLIGAEEAYEARCRHCHEVPGKPIPSWFNE